jgi:hypothetical protein
MATTAATIPRTGSPQRLHVGLALLAIRGSDAWLEVTGRLAA